MGLFGFLKKAAGKVLKAGLGQLTGGISDKAFSAIKQAGLQKEAQKQAAAQMETLKTQVQMVKLAPTMAPISTSAAMVPIRKAVGTRTRKKKAPKKRKTSRVARVPTRAPSKRRAPRGGLQLRAMAAEWRAAGKPGTWLGWIKSNPIKGG